MYLATKKEIELKKETAINILASPNPYINKFKVIKFLQDLEYINSLKFTKSNLVKESRQEKERKG